jgi:hypothetical protein
MEHVLFQDNTHVILKNEVPTFLYFVVKGSVVSMPFYLNEFSMNLNIL